MKRLLVAIQFLTIIPLGIEVNVSEKDIGGCSAAFVAVGILQGILLVAVQYLTGRIFPQDLAIAFTVFALVLINGGFHLDGLADTFDALAMKSEGDIEKDRQKRLALMKDGTTGPIGVIAIVFDLAFKYLLLRNLSNFMPFIFYSSILFLPVISKWTMVLSIHHAIPAKNNGLGHLMIKGTGYKEVVISTLTLLGLFITVLIYSKDYSPDKQYLFYLILVGLMYLVSLLVLRFFNKRFGGITGDNLGAINEISEILFLLWVVIWLRLFI